MCEITTKRKGGLTQCVLQKQISEISQRNVDWKGEGESTKFKSSKSIQSTRENMDIMGYGFF